MNKKQATPKSSPKAIKNLDDNNAHAQQARILEALKDVGEQGLTTLQIREELNCLHPAGRIRELRERGYVIHTLWTNTEDHLGRKHHVARYALMHQSKAA